MDDDRDLTETDLTAFDHIVATKIIYPLNKIPGLKVANRVASFYWYNKGIKSTEIGKKLGVENILEFGIKSSGTRLSVAVKLIKVESGSILWSEHYSLDRSEFSAILNKILQVITKKLQLKLPRQYIGFI
jgi:TolB-like protein